MARDIEFYKDLEQLIICYIEIILRDVMFKGFLKEKFIKTVN